LQEFSDIDTWVFDLDNTLYPRSCDLFSQIDVRMTTYVSQVTGLGPVEARRLQKDLYRDYGTTLRGLMVTRDIEPEAFLDHVHDIDYSPLPKTPGLEEKLRALPGRCLIYTNGSVAHAERTLEAMGVDPGLFDGIFDIIASDYDPKPSAAPFSRFLDLYDLDGTRAAMFEDLPRNLVPAKENGMVTILIEAGNDGDFKVESWEHAEKQAAHIDHATVDVEDFLGKILDVMA